jgi:selenocysteine lyase/cysteine desulfurase
MFDVQSLRRQFPSLTRLRDGVTPVFLDGPGGTQTPQSVIDAMVRYLTECNANHGGASRRASNRTRSSPRHWAVADLSMPLTR